MPTPISTLPKLILFEDEHLLVVNKPAGWNTHAPSPFAGEGVYDWLRHREPRWATLAIIHRLDKETSGVMVFAKSKEANRSLTAQFTEHSVGKKYFLATDREVRRLEFVVVTNLVRAGEKYVSVRAERAPSPRFSPPRRGRGSRSADAREGGQAETRFRVLASKDGRLLVEAQPVTGRTHQIRVHAAESGFPILGDELYGGTPAARVHLHAAELTLRHPAGATMVFTAPAEFEAAARQDLREAILGPGETTVWRMIHGASDGRAGEYVDRLGDFVLVQSSDPRSSRREEAHSGLHGKERSLPTLAAPKFASFARGIYHKRLDREVRKSSAAEASPKLIAGEAAPERFEILENGLRFELSFSEGYSVGLFLDQRDNRRRFLVNHIGAGFPLFDGGAEGREVLNTFAYTCGFSVAAAKAGARVTSLDLSKKYLDWGKRNFALNDLDPGAHDFIYGDAFDWLRRLAKKGRAFDVVVLDPPTFSQSKEGGVFCAEKDYAKLVSAALPVLKPGGVLFASTNAAALAAEDFLRAVETAVAKARRRIVQRHYVPQPPDFPVSREEPAYLKTVWMRLS